MAKEIAAKMATRGPKSVFTGQGLRLDDEPRVRGVQKPFLKSRALVA